MKSKENMLHSVISTVKNLNTHTHTHTHPNANTAYSKGCRHVTTYPTTGSVMYTFIPQCVQMCCHFNFPKSTDRKSQRPLSAQTILPTNLFGRDGELVGAIARTEARADVTHNMRSIAIGQWGQQVKWQGHTQWLQPGPPHIPQLCHITGAHWHKENKTFMGHTFHNTATITKGLNNNFISYRLSAVQSHHQM